MNGKRRAVNRKRKHSPASGESGQAVTEYVLILGIIVAAYMAMMTMVDRLRLGEKLMGPIVGSYARTYKFGHPEASGFDEGTLKRHPRATESGEVRLFINPVKTQ